MKKYSRSLIAFALLLGIGVVANAEVVDQVIVTLPFEFVVGGTTLPAGTYTVGRWSNPSGPLIVRSHDSGSSILVLPNVAEGVSADEPKLTFDHVGDRNFLSAVETATEIYHIPVARSLVTEAAARLRKDVPNRPSSGGN